MLTASESFDGGFSMVCVGHTYGNGIYTFIGKKFIQSSIYFAAILLYQSLCSF